MHDLVTQIYQHFEPLIDKPKYDDYNKMITYLMAEEFEYLDDTHSPPTIIKAKRILGIRSVKTKKGWVWTLPLRGPDEGMNEVHRRKMKDLNLVELELGKIQRPAARALTEVMTDFHLDEFSDIILKEMALRGYSRTTTVKMKGILGIASIKEEGRWHWVWPSRPVQDWLEAQLAAAPVALATLNERAWVEKSWTPRVLRLGKLALGTVQSRLIDNKLHWISVNSHGD